MVSNVFFLWPAVIPALVALLIWFFVTTIIFSESIINAVLALIALAALFSLLLFSFGATFLAVLYLAVYIGAVAVFFLFVVMMTDLSDERALKLKAPQPANLMILFFSLILSFIVEFFLHVACFYQNSAMTLWTIVRWDGVFNNAAFNETLLAFDSNIESLARVLFKEHLASFLILSLVILVALVGSILLTSSINTVDKHELAFFDLDPLSAVFESEKLSSFGDGKPQDMEQQLARTISSSVNLTGVNKNNLKQQKENG